MKIKFKFAVVVVFIILINSSFINFNKKTVVYNLPKKGQIATVLTEKEILKESQIPLLGKTFTGFKEALAHKESRGNYSSVNTLGYLGKYQFGKSTLKRLRIYNINNFLKDSELQERAFLALCSINKWILRKDIKRKEGKKINGILITESGILAASHLAGAGNVKKYLRSNGKMNVKDAYGSSIECYLEQFAGYDTFFIVANKNAKVL